MNLYYDENDDAYLRKRGIQTLYWLDDVDAKPLTEASPNDAGFLFSCARTIDAYANLVKDKPFLRDRPEEREPLLSLDLILDHLDEAGVFELNRREIDGNTQ